MVKVSVLVSPTWIEERLKDLLILGAWIPPTISVAVAALPVPPSVELTAPLVF